LQKFNPSTQYKETQIQTANQGKLIVMMYDGAIKFIKVAIENLPKNKYDIVNKNIIKAEDIILELMLSINFEAGEFANKLFSLYSYMHRRLMEGNIQKDSKPLNEVLGYLEDLREAWAQVVDETSSNNYNVSPSSGVNIST